MSIFMPILMPIIIQILGALINKFVESRELKQRWLDFVQAAAAEGVVSVKLGNEAEEQRKRLAAGKWQKPGEDFSVEPPKEKL